MQQPPDPYPQQQWQRHWPLIKLTVLRGIDSFSDREVGWDVGWLVLCMLLLVPVGWAYGWSTFWDVFCFLTAVVIFGLLIWFKILTQHILQYGDLVEGLITEHPRHYSFSETFYSLTYYYLTYTYEYGGKTYSKKPSVSKKFYREILDGTRISVRCLPQRPQIARIDKRRGFIQPPDPFDERFAP